MMRHDLETYREEMLHVADSAAYEHNLPNLGPYQAAKGDYYPTTGVVTIENYIGSTFFKGFESRVAQRDGTTNYVSVISGYWKNAGAITSVELSASAGNFITGTVATFIAE